MSEPNSERIITPMPPSLVKAIDDYRYRERIPSRAEAIRRLVEQGLGQHDQNHPSTKIPPVTGNKDHV